jgi:hypothetical protein
MSLPLARMQKDQNIERLEKISAVVTKEFASLNNTQLNWKPSPDGWSIGQVLDHLVVSNSRYFPALDQALSGKYAPTFWEKFNPLTGYTGRNMINTLGATVIKKYSAPLLFRPLNGMITADIIGKFQLMQGELISLCSRNAVGGYDDRKITSPVAKLITLTVRDTLSLLTAHEERHLNQAMRIKNSAEFPV